MTGWNMCRSETAEQIAPIMERKRKEVVRLDFLKQHWAYADQCANCRAIEIANITGRHSDIEDFKQEILVWIMRRAGSYNAQRGKPTTFIAMASSTAKKRILRRQNRQKHKVLFDAVPLP